MPRATTSGRPLVRFCGLAPTIGTTTGKLICLARQGVQPQSHVSWVFIIIRSLRRRRSLPRPGILYWHEIRALILGGERIWVAVVMMLMMLTRLLFCAILSWPGHRMGKVPYPSRVFDSGDERYCARVPPRHRIYLSGGCKWRRSEPEPTWPG